MPYEVDLGPIGGGSSEKVNLVPPLFYEADGSMNIQISGTGGIGTSNGMLILDKSKSYGNTGLNPIRIITNPTIGTTYSNMPFKFSAVSYRVQIIKLATTDDGSAIWFFPSSLSAPTTISSFVSENDLHFVNIDYSDMSIKELVLTYSQSTSTKSYIKIKSYKKKNMSSGAETTLSLPSSCSLTLYSTFGNNTAFAY